MTSTVEDLITCSSCKRHFNNPCLLSCSHTYCRQCIENGASSNGQYFKCDQHDEPRSLTRNINSLPINQALRDLIESYTSIQRSNLCANCLSATPEYACNTCINVNFCLNCYETVHTPPVMRNHQQLSISERLPEVVSCSIHSKQSIRMLVSNM